MIAIDKNNCMLLYRTLQDGSLWQAYVSQLADVLTLKDVGNKENADV